MGWGCTWCSCQLRRDIWIVKLVDGGNILAMSPSFTSLLWNKLEIKVVLISHSYKFSYVSMSFSKQYVLSFVSLFCVQITLFHFPLTHSLTFILFLSVIWHSSQITIIHFIYFAINYIVLSSLFLGPAFLLVSNKNFIY